MPWVVFVRGANVGGRNTFRPSALARELPSLGVVNVGAAATFVVRAALGQASLRAEILGNLPFHPKVMICPGSEIVGLAREEPFS